MPFGYRKRSVKAKVTKPTRFLGNEYQNTTGRPLLIIIAVHCVRTSAVGAFAFITAKIGTSSPPVDAVANEGLYNQDNNPDDVLTTAIFAVPNSYYYRVGASVDALGSTVTLDDWTEVEL